MTPQPQDQAQRKRAAEEVDATFLVEAAAGAGKTTLLVSRILAILRKRRASLAQVCAITFTEKAAGELKARLRESIERELREGPKEERAVFRRALGELDAMSVSTIHSFCSDMIRELPLEAGVEPGFGMADELAADLLFEETWEAWLAEEMSRPNPPLRAALERGIAASGAGFNSPSLPSLARFLVDNRDLLQCMATAPKWNEDDFARAAQEIQDRVAALDGNVRADCKAPDADKAAAAVMELLRWTRTWTNQRAAGIAEWLDAAPKVPTNHGTKRNWSSEASLGEARQGLKDVLGLVERARGAFTHNILADLAEWIRPFVDRYEQAKQARNLADFQDLLLRARDMLAHSRMAREHFKDAWRYVLVDEFQDTDPLQTEIVFFLCERKGAFAPDWRQADLEPGKLFIVGDPKQSIYGFRRADLDLYGAVRERIAAQGEILDLHVNFRTVPGVIEEVNRTFEPLMRGPVEGRFEPSHVALIPFRSDAGKRPNVARIAPPEPLADAGLRIEAWRRREAGCVAACLRRLVESGIEIYDKERKAMRPCRWSDAAVLFRATTGLEALEDALRAHDVPYQVAGGKHYYTRLEFSDLLNVLKAIENPYDAVSVVGALRSPFFGHSDEDLAAHVLAGGSFNYLAPPPSADARLSLALETLAALHKRRADSSATALLVDLFSRTQALQIYAMKPHGEQRVANLLKVQDMARALEEAEIRSFGAFVRRLAEMRTVGHPESESPIAEAEDDFVQLMTFHKAKGLEFPIVFLAFLGSDTADKDAFVIGRGDRRLHLNFGQDRRTLDWDQAVADRRSRSEHEEIRLFYVAMTRARDLLFLPDGWTPKGRPGFLKYLPLCEIETDARENIRCSPPFPPFADVGEADLLRRRRDEFRIRPSLEGDLSPQAQAFAQHRQEWMETLKRRAERLNTARKVRTATRGDQPPGEEVPSRRKGEADPNAAAFGKLVHRLLEMTDFTEAAGLAASAEIEARRLGIADRAEEAAALARRAFDMPVVRNRAMRAEGARREVPFTALYGDELLEGRVDLVFIENGGAVIVDFKTDRVAASEASKRAEEYRGQAEVYARAMTAALGMPVTEVIFAFVRPGVEVSLPGVGGAG